MMNEKIKDPSVRTSPERKLGKIREISDLIAIYILSQKIILLAFLNYLSALTLSPSPPSSFLSSLLPLPSSSCLFLIPPLSSLLLRDTIATEFHHLLASANLLVELQVLID